MGLLDSSDRWTNSRWRVPNSARMLLPAEAQPQLQLVPLQQRHQTTLQNHRRHSNITHTHTHTHSVFLSICSTHQRWWCNTHRPVKLIKSAAAVELRSWELAAGGGRRRRRPRCQETNRKCGLNLRLSGNWRRFDQICSPFVSVR